MIKYLHTGAHQYSQLATAHHTILHMLRVLSSIPSRGVNKRQVVEIDFSQCTPQATVLVFFIQLLPDRSHNSVLAGPHKK